MVAPPKPPKPLTWKTRLGATWYALLGAAALFLGVHDLLFALPLTFRLDGILLALLGLALLTCVVGYRRRRTWSYTLAVVAGLAAAAYAVLLLIAQAINDLRFAKVGGWFVIAALSVVAATIAGNEGRVSFAHLARSRIQVLSSVLSVGALISIAQFWSASVRVPPASAPSLSVTTDLRQLPSKTGPVRLAGTITLRDTAAVKIWVLGSLYTLYGMTVDRPPTKARPVLDGLLQSIQAGQANGYGASYYDGTKSLDMLLDSGPLTSDLTYLVPGEEVTYHLAFYAPRGSYDVARLETSFEIAKDTMILDEQQQSKPRRVHDRYGTRIDSVRSLRETSWLSRLLRGSRVLHTGVWYDAKQTPYAPTVFSYVDEAGAPPADGGGKFSVKMSRLFGIAEADSAFELPLS